MIQFNVSLKPYNTFGIDVISKAFASFSTVEELQFLLKNEATQSLPKLILGGGSNILLTKNFEGLVLKNDLKGIEIKTSGDDVFLKAQAGEVWHDVVLFSVDQNLGGLENLSLIPGNVGAAPMQNIGAYGVEIKDVFEELEAYEIATGEIKTFRLNDCKFGYRESVFKRDLKDQFIILNVTFRLSKTPKINTSYGAINDELKKMGVEHPTVKDVSNAVIAIRKSKLPDPKKLGNSGSFFKNPVVEKNVFETIQKNYPDAPSYPAGNNLVKLAAGWLIEKAGWKGRVTGHCGVHKNQALVLVNYGSASGQEIYQLSQEILESVKNQFGVELEREVNIL